MEQEEFTDFVISKLLSSFSDFDKHIQLKDDKTADIEYSSKRGKLKLFINTRNKELTVGFSAGQSQFGWHVHMGMYGAETPEEMAETAVMLIKEILNDKKRIVFTSYLGYFLIEDEDELEDYIYDGEKLELHNWSEL
ncbi:hypothetical protein EFA69_10540 [Rufibacter immobilis]|uniref:Uncharacterized protein n=1 Tax=Rufibacter immobilis TaxID=1348778 RepID=A0A3M9MWQ4_9BACT|nr:hypothetical protein [Rufibacter immobilis]RNI29956.1 hypothetical protein EFA69_10540 [Rufibacter immobilis]